MTSGSEGSLRTSAELEGRRALQRRGPRTVRRHAGRALARIAWLVTGDALVFFIVREAVRAVRDQAAFGDAASDMLGYGIPRGLLSGLNFLVALITGLAVTGNYGAGDARRNPRSILSGIALASAMVVWSRIPLEGAIVTAQRFTVLTVIFWACITIGRMLANRVQHGLGLHRVNLPRVILVGTADECHAAMTGPAFEDRRAADIVGFVESNNADRNSLGGIEDLERLLVDHTADTVMLCGLVTDDELRQVAGTCREAGCELYALPRQFKLTGAEPTLIWRRGQPLIDLTSPAVRAGDRSLKRAIDLVGSLTGVILLSPLLLIVAAIIKIDSPGPVFYQSARWGRFGRRIGIWKFRTMIKDAPDLTASGHRLSGAFLENIKLVDDPRVTRVGRFLRRWSIDELPQLWNVVVGELSLVGPRPKLINEAEKYGAALPTVLAVRPGITGLWQVSGRNTTSYDERVALDVHYVTHASLWDDLSILTRTLPVVLRGTGAH